MPRQKEVNDWAYSPPEQPGFYLRMTSEGQLVLHRVWEDSDGRLLIRFGGVIWPLDLIGHKLSWYMWCDIGVHHLPSYGEKTKPEDSVAKENY